MHLKLVDKTANLTYNIGERYSFLIHQQKGGHLLWQQIHLNVKLNFQTRNQ